MKFSLFNEEEFRDRDGLEVVGLGEVDFLFGASLKKEYDPEIEDAEIEEIIFWIDNGAL